MRLITRANMDGVTCGVLIGTMEIVESSLFTNAKDIEEKLVFIRPGDILADLPFHPKASMWFDHHIEALNQSEEQRSIKGKRGQSPSAARLVFEYYNSPKLDKYDDLLEVNDCIDSANLTVDDILNPSGWHLIASTLDPYESTPAYHAYVNNLIDWIKAGTMLEDLLEMKDVKSRIQIYRMDADYFEEELRNVTRLEDNVIITDYRAVDLMPFGNRFLVFAMFRQGNVQVRIYPEADTGRVRIRLGKSPVTRTCNLNLGKFCLEYGGGGLEGAAGFVVDREEADQKIKEVVAKLKQS